MEEQSLEAYYVEKLVDPEVAVADRVGTSPAGSFGYIRAGLKNQSICGKRVM